MNNTKFCVMGAGNGAIAMAAHLAIKGYEVNIYNRSLDKTPNLVNTKEITLTGDETGKAKINLVTDDAALACQDVNIILIAIPANGHLFMAEKLAPILKEDQIIILNPGRTGGALEVYEYLSKYSKVKNPIVAEAQSLVYACRAITDTEVHVFQVKNEVSLGTMPANKTNYVIDILNKVYPGIFVPAVNVWETSINNYGAIFHPAPTLLNMSRIESGESFKYYTEGITKGISKVLQDMDEERVKIGRALGVDTMSTLKWLEVTYDAKGETIEDAVKNVDAYKGIISPASLDVRYIKEDVPYSLVPLESLAKELSIETPNISAIIDLANTVFDTDYRENGRTADKLGLKGLSIEEINKLVNEGNLGGII